MDNFWTICLGRFQQELSTQQFNTWIKPLQFESHDDTWRLLAPNRFVQQWVKDRFLDRIKLIAEEVVTHPIEIELAVSTQPASLVKESANLGRDNQTLQDTTPKLKNGSAISSKPPVKTTRKTRVDGESSGLNSSFNF